MKSKLKRNLPQGACMQCLIIRYFLLAVFALVLIALFAGENKNYLSLLRVDLLIGAMFGIGIFGGILRFWIWKNRGAN
tara:strand:- start:428 stop:661 length:234 start_codon:yes stop_codon:yes gene_type:complete